MIYDLYSPQRFRSNKDVTEHDAVLTSSLRHFVLILRDVTEQDSVITSSLRHFVLISRCHRTRLRDYLVTTTLCAHIDVCTVIVEMSQNKTPDVTEQDSVITSDVTEQDSVITSSLRHFVLISRCHRTRLRDYLVTTTLCDHIDVWSVTVEMSQNKTPDVTEQDSVITSSLRHIVIISRDVTEQDSDITSSLRHFVLISRCHRTRLRDYLVTTTLCDHIDVCSVTVEMSQNKTPDVTEQDSVITSSLRHFVLISMCGLSL
ncbi:hypothetical protein DPMN_052036 [Dreissena polymorpha]|uniref:Uncharacterized protein n=1 Tax=Dreissena polymorpha TaxID=45954 RepID=A0A9D4CK85_DREPO|nr:hypothetical protein DPMN_052036 [Dreissena polymorpha]